MNIKNYGAHGLSILIALSYPHEILHRCSASYASFTEENWDSEGTLPN